MKRSTFLSLLLLAAVAVAEETKNPDGWSWVSDSKDIGTQEVEDKKTGEELIDDILGSSRQGRNLDSTYNDIYNDPQVQQALQEGNDTTARHYVKERLCNLGLMAVSKQDKEFRVEKKIQQNGIAILLDYVSVLIVGRGILKHPR